MNPPRYRSVAVHWPRLLAGCAVMTGLLILAVEWEPAAPVLDSPLLSMLAIGLMMAGVVGFGRPGAEFELRDEGVLRREGLVFSAFRRASWMPWAAIERCDLAEELDGSRSLTLRTRHGATWKLWEKFGSGGDFDAFHREIATRLARRSVRDADAAAPAEMHSAWDGGGARIAVGVLAIAWVALGVAAAMGPAEGRGARLARLAAVGLLLAPLLIRAFFGRRAHPRPASGRTGGVKSP